MDGGPSLMYDADALGAFELTVGGRALWERLVWRGLDQIKATGRIPRPGVASRLDDLVNARRAASLPVLHHGQGMSSRIR